MVAHGQATACSDAPAAVFVARWVGHDTWPEWSSDAEWVRVVGDGAHGQVRPRVRFEMMSLDPPQGHTEASRVPASRLLVRQTATESGADTRADVDVTRSVPPARLWGATIGRGRGTFAQRDLDRPVALTGATP